MSTMKEIEDIVNEYEKRIQQLKILEGRFNELDTIGFENKASEIRILLKDPKALEKVEAALKELEREILEKRKPTYPRDIPPPSHHFPIELRSYYYDDGEIGKGGFARVFRAKRKSDNKEIALKIPISMERAIGKSFIKEMENWTKLKHENIVTVYDYNVIPIPYIEMELCDSSLEVLQKPITVEKSAMIVFDIAEGLKYAHDKGIVHRDIKPQNILLLNGAPKITDWGLSKVTAESKTTTTLAYSPVYAAPEHITKKYGEKDYQTDIWQLGIIFYELVTGTLPFKGDDITEISLKIINDEHTPPSMYTIDAAPVDHIIATCLQKQKKFRYKNLHELQKDLAEFLNKEYKSCLKKSQDCNDLSKSRVYCKELVLINLKSGDTIEACKYATSMLPYAHEEGKKELRTLIAELEERIEQNLGVSELLIVKAEMIMHRIVFSDM
jgi:serine/threonine protein kinase